MDGSKERCPLYVDVVLRPGFHEAKHRFYEPMLAVHKAHTVMLAERGIISPEVGRKVMTALFSVEASDLRNAEYDPTYEDLFFMMERRILDEAGDVAGNMHIARSRNDLDTTMYRMVLRDGLLAGMEEGYLLTSGLVAFATQHLRTVMPGYTHDQQAQPTTLAHYMGALIDALLRDLERFQSLYLRVNRSPLGAAAFATTGFPIDRRRTMSLLGFQGLVENSYDAIGGSDYLAEAAAVVQVSLSTLSRCVTDLLFWVSNEVGTLRVADAYVQISSIMPQKRNPVVLEHLRSLIGKAIGQMHTVLLLAHNTPFGDIVDTGDDVQPALHQGLSIYTDVVKLLHKVVATLQVNEALMLERARQGYSVVTELADTLVRVEGLPFRTAHTIVSRFVDIGTQQGLTLSEMRLVDLRQAAEGVIAHPLGITEDVFRRALDPVQFVEIRCVTGGPSPGEMARQLVERLDVLTEFREWILTARRSVESSFAELDIQSRHLADGTDGADGGLRHPISNEREEHSRSVDDRSA